MGLERVGDSKVFVGSRPESTKNFVEAGIKNLFAIHLDADLKIAFEKKGINVHILPTIMDPIVSPKIITQITKLANKSKGNIAFTCMAGAHVSNAYAGIYLAQKGWPIDKIMRALDVVSVKASKRHISTGLEDGIRETIILSYKNFLRVIKPRAKRIIRKRIVRKKVIRRK